ncbi:hypothetical protein BGX31_003269 [Mortierella sp. GBA43]|nr:hypothetical protein BGX31_003269 [Mortierella sp. GBA43]
MEAAPIRSQIAALKLPDVGAGYPGLFMEGILRSHSFRGLYFDDQDYSCRSRVGLWTLTQHRFSTLRTIELEGYEVVDSSDLQAMFSRSRKLQKFTITIVDGCHGAIDFKDTVDAEWVCLDLEELNLILARGDSEYARVVTSEDTSEDEDEEEKEDYFDESVDRDNVNGPHQSSKSRHDGSGTQRQHGRSVL